MDRIHRMSRGRKTLLSLLLVGAIGAVAGIGTFSAFSATTVNAGNVFAAGTVSISDNDAGSRDVHHRERDAAEPRREVHRGHVHRLAAGGRAPVQLGDRRDRAVRRPHDRQGHRFDRVPELCGVRARRQPHVFTGTLGGFADGEHQLRERLPGFPGVQTAWNQNDVVVYRFTLTLQNNPAATGRPRGAQLHVGGAEPVDRLDRSRGGARQRPARTRLGRGPRPRRSAPTNSERGGDHEQDRSYEPGAQGAPVAPVWSAWSAPSPASGRTPRSRRRP